MREENDPLPSKEESKRETKKRLKILEKIIPDLRKFSEAVIIVGSVAYGKNFSVRKESDIDLLILINREEASNIFVSHFFESTPQLEEAIQLFINKEVDHFSVIKEIENVSLQFHFWDKEAHFKAELLQSPPPKIYNIWRLKEPFLLGIDFSGKKRYLRLDKVIKYKFGDVHIYPSYFVDNKHFVPRQPILNLITNPDIVFTKDKTLLKNIDKIWENLAKRLIKESDGKINLKKKSIIKSVYGYWNLSLDSKEKLEKRQKKELAKLGVI